MLTKKKINLRLISQILFFIIIAAITVNHSLAEQGSAVEAVPSASIHAVCPFGGVVSIYRFVTQGSFVQKVHEASFSLMVIVFFSAVLFGPVFCGWGCPFGSFQEWVGKLGRRFFGRRYNSLVPRKADRLLGYLRYLVLVWVVYATAVSAKLVFSTYDPYSALFTFWTSEVQLTAVAILILVILASLFVERPWCKYACPYGALLGLTNLVRPFSIRREPSTCISCGKCDRTCPMNIKVSESTNVRDTRCISCMECTSGSACPVKETVELTAPSPRRSANEAE